MHGKADGPTDIGNAAGGGLTDPPRGIRRELETFSPVELLHGVYQTEIALLDEVEERQARYLVLLGDRHHQPEVRLHERLLGLLALEHGPPQHALLRRRQTSGRRRQLRACLTPSFDGLGQPPLIVLGEQRVLTDTGQVQPYQVLIVSLEALLCQVHRILCVPRLCRDHPSDVSTAAEPAATTRGARGTRPLSVSLPDASTAPNGRPSLPPSLDGSGDGDSAVEGTGGSALSLDYGFRSDAVDGHQQVLVSPTDNGAAKSLEELFEGCLERRGLVEGEGRVMG